MEGTTNHTCDINSKNKTADPVALVNKTGFIYFQPYEVIGFFSRLILQMVKVEKYCGEKFTHCNFALK